jgi:hypothetical protein
MADTMKAREEAAGRKAAAQVRAIARRGARPAPAGTQPSKNPTAEGNANDNAAAAATPAPTTDTPAPPRERDPRLPPVGTVLQKRDRAGNERVRCTIVNGGVEYSGTLCKSLSAAAIAAAKDLGLKSTTQDGYAFWQLKKAAHREKDPVAALEQAWERYRLRAAATIKAAGDEEHAKVQEVINQHLGALNKLATELG